MKFLFIFAQPQFFILQIEEFYLTLHSQSHHGTMAEWLGIGLQNRAQQFDSAWYLTRKRLCHPAQPLSLSCAGVSARLWYLGFYS